MSSVKSGAMSSTWSIQSMKDAGEILAAVPDLGFRAEDARAI